MSKRKGGFSELFYSTIMPKIYGIGAAVVIVGALFKIQHWEGANEMLILGLGTEALIFLFSAFEPMHAEPDWAKVYPELADDYDGAPSRIMAGSSANDGSISKKLDHMLESAKIGPDLVSSLGKGMKNLATSAASMANLSDAAVATNDYANNVKSASESIKNMNESYKVTANAVTAMADATKDASEYHTQVKSVTKNLGALNAVYEMELQDANSHLKAMNKFYSNVSTAMDSMTEASAETEKFKTQMSGLTSNITSLNSVYGNMLAAMKG